MDAIRAQENNTHASTAAVKKSEPPSWLSMGPLERMVGEEKALDNIEDSQLEPAFERDLKETLTWVNKISEQLVGKRRKHPMIKPLGRDSPEVCRRLYERSLKKGYYGCYGYWYNQWQIQRRRMQY